MQAHEEGGEAGKGGHMGEGIGAPGARYMGEHVVVRALGGYGPLFVAADILLVCVVTHSDGCCGGSDQVWVSTRRGHALRRDAASGSQANAGLLGGGGQRAAWTQS